MLNSLENAFPLHCRNDINTIKNYLVLDDIDTHHLVTLNQNFLQIPYRIYNEAFTMVQLESLTHHQQLILFCIYTRHHNGFIRHEMVKHIMKIHPVLKENDFVIPYIFLLGEYVAEICEDLYPYIKANKSVIHQFIQENKEFSYLTYQRSVSYWNEFYRLSRYKHLRDYPARKVFDLFPFIYRRKLKLSAQQLFIAI